MDILIEELEGSLWVAALEHKRINSLEVDPFTEEIRWGSIYRARVERIDATLDAAFVKLDSENTGILNAKDVRIRDKSGAYIKPDNKPIGKLLKSGQFILVQAKAGYLPKEEDLESKAPRVSMNVTLPGRYLIYTPFDKENRISIRIRNKKMRKQLLDMLNYMEDCTGCILRSAANDTQTDVLIRENQVLKSVWEQMILHNKGDEPCLIMAGPDAVQRTLSDNANATIDRIEVVTMEHFQDTEEWCEIFAPDLVTKIVPVEVTKQNATQKLNMGLFDLRDIVDQIESFLQPYAILENGGNIIIQDTAALTAIDINKGSDKRSHLATNVEAAQETARQLRIRNIGGIIIIDFLKMRTKKDKDSLLKNLKDLFDKDPCTVQVHGFTALGLVEISRSRRTPPLQERFNSALETLN